MNIGRFFHINRLRTGLYRKIIFAEELREDKFRISNLELLKYSEDWEKEFILYIKNLAKVEINKIEKLIVSIDI